MPGGDAATLVLLHGLFDSAKGWRDLPRRMRAAGHAVLTPDLPGHESAATVASHDAAVKQRAARMPPGPLRLLDPFTGGGAGGAAGPWAGVKGGADGAVGPHGPWPADQR